MPRAKVTKATPEPPAEPTPRPRLGRPKKAEVNASRTVSLPEKMWSRLDEDAERLGKTRSDVMAEAVQLYFARHKIAYP